MTAKSVRAATSFVVTAGRGRFQLTATVVTAGADLTVIVTGGDRPHIGAAALAQHAPGAAAGEPTVTASVLTVPGHREDELARELAIALSRSLGSTVMVAAGMHWDRIEKAEIDCVLRHCQTLGAAIVRRLKTASPHGPTARKERDR
jgi:gallate decarboxylase subunit D